jgi:hypothetical protein
MKSDPRVSKDQVAQYTRKCMRTGLNQLQLEFMQELYEKTKEFDEYNKIRELEEEIEKLKEENQIERGKSIRLEIQSSRKEQKIISITQEHKETVKNLKKEINKLKKQIDEFSKQAEYRSKVIENTRAMLKWKPEIPIENRDARVSRESEIVVTAEIVEPRKTIKEKILSLIKH